MVTGPGWTAQWCSQTYAPLEKSTLPCILEYSVVGPTPRVEDQSPRSDFTQGSGIPAELSPRGCSLLEGRPHPYLRGMLALFCCLGKQPTLLCRPHNYFYYLFPCTDFLISLYYSHICEGMYTCVCRSLQKSEEFCSWKPNLGSMSPMEQQRVLLTAPHVYILDIRAISCSASMCPLCSTGIFTANCVLGCPEAFRLHGIVSLVLLLLWPQVIQCCSCHLPSHRYILVDGSHSHRGTFNYLKHLTSSIKNQKLAGCGGGSQL